MSPATYMPPEGSIPTLGVPSLDGIGSAHLVGVGGAGMSGIAKLLLARGVRVSGSDLKDSRSLQELDRLGATVWAGHDAARLGDPDVVVVSTAIPERNEEVAEARARGLPILARAQMLAALAAGRRLLAVAGTHGKTTTTSMLAVIVDRAGLDPSYVIGGHLNESGSGARHGDGDVFVAEADESDGSFLLLRPEVGVVTNVEADHLDFYRGGLEEIQGAFAQFVERSRVVVACGDDPGARSALAGAGVAGITFGVTDGNRVRIEVGPVSNGRGIHGALELEDGARIDLALRVPGAHNLSNAAAAILAAREVGVPPRAAAEAITTFSGVHRRFERRAEARGAVFFDDYAHHPTELRATLSAASALKPARIVAVFQPHRYSRTAQLWRELGESLAGADLVVVTDVYGAGEPPIPGVSGQLLVDALHEFAPEVRVVYLPHRSELAPFLAGEIQKGDAVLTLGAGDVSMVTDEVIARLKETV